MLDLNSLKAKVDGLVRSHDLVFDGVFEAFTPWWGGDSSGCVFSPGQGGLVPHYPEPKAIIGRTKWAIRTVLGYVPKELGEVGQGPKDTGVASAVKVFVDVVSGGKPYFTEADLPRVSGDKRKYRSELNAMREVGYEMLFEGYRSKEKLERLVDAYRKRRTEFYKLLTIPRFYLRAMGKTGEDPREVIRRALLFQPMRPGFKIRVRVLSRDRRAGRLFATAMMVTLKYLGVGGAANRGFGRFRLLKVDYAAEGINTEVDITRDDLYDVFKQLGYEPKVNPRGRDPRFPRFPLPDEVKRVNGPVSAFINGRKYRARDVEGVLAAMGTATLKSTWKSYCNNLLGSGRISASRGYTRPSTNNLLGSGREYHTWVLGLPRKVGNTGYFVSQSKGKSRSPESQEEEGGRRQSYIVLSPTEGLGALLIPFYADDYPGIEHRDHGKPPQVVTVGRVTPDCEREKASRLVRDHIETALDWLQELLE